MVSVRVTKCLVVMDRAVMKSAECTLYVYSFFGDPGKPLLVFDMGMVYPAGMRIRVLRVRVALIFSLNVSTKRG